MAGLLQGIVGGGLRGAGTGIVEHNAALRQQALERARMLHEERMRQMDRDFALKRDAAQREESRGLLQSTHVGEDRGVRGVTRGGEVIDLGFRAADTRRTTDDEGGMSPRDKTLLDAAIEANTTEDEFGNARVDKDGIADALIERGRPDLAALYRPVGGRARIDPNDPLWDEARAYAADRVEEMDRWWRGQAADFKDYGGSRVEAERRLAEQFYFERKGSGAGAPSGQGSRDRPDPAAPSAPPEWAASPSYGVGYGSLRSPGQEQQFRDEDTGETVTLRVAEDGNVYEVKGASRQAEPPASRPISAPAANPPRLNFQEDRPILTPGVAEAAKAIIEAPERAGIAAVRALVEQHLNQLPADAVRVAPQAARVLSAIQSNGPVNRADFEAIKELSDDSLAKLGFTTEMIEVIRSESGATTVASAR